MDRIKTYMGKDITKYKKSELINLISNQQRALLDLAERNSRSPIVMMEPKEVVEEYHKIKRGIVSFKKIFWRFYWK